MAGVWAKIGKAVKRGARTAKGVLLLAPRALVYPVKVPFALLGEMKRDTKVSLGGAASVGAPEKEKGYGLPAGTAEAGRGPGVKTNHKDGEVGFLASGTLVGSVSCLTPEQLGKIKELNLDKKNKSLGVAVSREENKVTIEVNVKGIIDRIKNASEGEEKSPEETKRLVLKRVRGEVDRSLKDLARITGGGFRVHTDRKLLHDVVERLYGGCGERLLKAVGSTKESPERSSESITEFNMTNPSQFPFPFGKEAISPAGMQLPQGAKGRAEELGAFLNFGPGEVIRPLSRPADDKKVKGRG